MQKRGFESRKERKYLSALKSFFFKVYYKMFLITSLTIISSIIVISARNPIHSIIALIAVVINFVILLFLLGAEFLALIFVSVYLGAVVVLFLFVMMMFDISTVDSNKGIAGPLSIIFLPAAVIGVVYLESGIVSPAEMGGSVLRCTVFRQPVHFDWKSIVDDISNIEAIGSLLYTYFAPLLLMVGVILLIAVIGAVVLTKANQKMCNNKKLFADQQTARDFKNAVFYAREKKNSKLTLSVKQINPKKG